LANDELDIKKTGFWVASPLPGSLVQASRRISSLPAGLFFFYIESMKLLISSAFTNEIDSESNEDEFIKAMKDINRKGGFWSP